MCMYNCLLSAKAYNKMCDLNSFKQQCPVLEMFS